MILRSFLLALAQLSDPRFRRVLWRGAGLALLLLAGSSALLLWALQALLPETFSLPWLGEVAWLDAALGWAAVPLLLLASVVLMVPVASAMTGLFLDEVAQAVEDAHHPGLPRVRSQPWAESLGDALAFLGVIVVANAGALALSLGLAPLAPLIFLAVNGYLLGREYFQLAALRRSGRAEARALARRHRGTIWLAGCLMALPLLIPVVNLLVPVLGAATFTHLYHRLSR